MADQSTTFESYTGDFTTTPETTCMSVAVNTGTGPFTVSTAQAYAGSKACRWPVAGASQINARLLSNSRSGLFSLRFYFRVSALPTSGNAIPLPGGLFFGSYRGMVFIKSDGKMQWGYHDGGLGISGSATSVAVDLNTWHRMEYSNSGANTVKARFYRDPTAAVGSYDAQITTTDFDMSGNFVLGLAACNSTSTGLIDTSGFVGDLWIDDVYLKDMASSTTETWIGPGAATLSAAASPSFTATITATGAATKSAAASLTATATITAAATAAAERIADASGTTTATVTATATRTAGITGGLATTATVTASATVAAGGTPSADATANIAAAVTAAVAAGRVAGTSLSTTAAISASATVLVGGVGTPGTMSPLDVTGATMSATTGGTTTQRMSLLSFDAATMTAVLSTEATAPLVGVPVFVGPDDPVTLGLVAAGSPHVWFHAGTVFVQE